jgi:hypothetical protein|nr:MAG TPA: holin [Caudoviricetes sp.]
MQITLDSIIPVITVVVSYIFGLLAKKFNWYESKYIPIQNGVIGVISAIIYYLAVPDCNFIVVLFTALSGFAAGGLYDASKTKNN